LNTEPGVDVHGTELLDGGSSCSTPSVTPVCGGWRKGWLAMVEDKESEEDLSESGPHVGADPCGTNGPPNFAATAAPKSKEIINAVSLEDKEGDLPETKLKTGACACGMDWDGGAPKQPRMLSLAHSPIPGHTGGGNLAHPLAEEEEEDSPRPRVSLLRVHIKSNLSGASCTLHHLICPNPMQLRALLVKKLTKRMGECTH